MKNLKFDIILSGKKTFPRGGKAMRYLKLKTVIFTLLTVSLFPVTAYAVVDGGSYITTTNNDVNTQAFFASTSKT